MMDDNWTDDRHYRFDEPDQPGVYLTHSGRILANIGSQPSWLFMDTDADADEMEWLLWDEIREQLDDTEFPLTRLTGDMAQRITGRNGTSDNGSTFRTEHYEMSVEQAGHAIIARSVELDRETGFEVPHVDCLHGTLRARITPCDGRLDARQAKGYAKFLDNIAGEMEDMQRYTQTEWAVMRSGVRPGPCVCGGMPVVEDGRKTYINGSVVTREKKIRCPNCGRNVSHTDFGGVEPGTVIRDTINEWNKEGAALDATINGRTTGNVRETGQSEMFEKPDNPNQGGEK